MFPGAIFRSKSSVRKLPLPLAIAPTGSSGLFAHRGDLGLARAAAAFGIPFIQSTVSTLEARDGCRRCRRPPLDAALYAQGSGRDRGHRGARGSRGLRSARLDHGHGRLRQSRMGPAPLRPAGTIGALEQARGFGASALDAWDVLVPNGVPVFENILEFLPGRNANPVRTRAFLVQQMDPSITFKEIAWLKSIWPRKLVVKGVLDVEDARRLADSGVDGIVVSNHGARQLDGSVSPIEVLPAIADAVGSRLCVMIDGGFRRGTDIVKAIGARRASRAARPRHALRLGGRRRGGGETRAFHFTRGDRPHRRASGRDELERLRRTLASGLHLILGRSPRQVAARLASKAGMGHKRDLDLH